jgi:hypothetical protein
MAIYNNPYIGQAVSNIAQLFAPPSAGDMAAGAQIGLLNAKTASERQGAQRLADFYGKITDPNTPRDMADRYGIGAGAFNPSQGYYSVDTQAATSRANNTADNARALQTNEADNKRALEQTLLGPLNQGQTRFIPKSIGGMYDLPETQSGIAPNLSETEWQAQQNERLRASGQLSDDDIRRGIMGDIPTEEIVGADGKPVISYRPDAVGQQPAPKSPLVQVGPGGTPLPNLEPGYAWKTGPDGKPVFENGVPTAVPYPGGKAFQQQQDAAKQAGVQDATRQRAADVVSQDIDRALGAAGTFTTGLIGSQLSNVPGTGANDLRTLLDTVKANVGFDKLQAMREASPTGGALGQVSDTENRMLQATLGSLEQTQTKEQFVDNLKRLKNIYLDIIHGPGQGPAREPLGFEQQGAAPGSRGVGGAAPQAGAVPAFEQMDAAGLRSWVETNSEAVKALSDADFQRLRARAQQLQGAQ